MPTDDRPAVHVAIESREAGEVARVTVDNAAKLNVVGSALMDALAEGVAALGMRPRLRALVVTGAGDRAFIGGADIREMSSLDSAGAREFITRLHRVCATLRDLPVPVIARVNGYALGAGLEVAAACDLRIAAAEAVFGMPEVRVGIPSVIEAALLPGLIGWGRTRELLLLGATIDAGTALRWGLVERVAPPGELDAAVEACLTALLEAGPRATRLQKKLIRRWEDLPVSDAITAGIDAFADAYSTEEPARLMRAFLDRPRN
jgi:enoyl-CoA hydratase/carnithine racemase